MHKQLLAIFICDDATPHLLPSSNNSNTQEVVSRTGSSLQHKVSHLCSSIQMMSWRENCHILVTEYDLFLAFIVFWCITLFLFDQFLFMIELFVGIYTFMVKYIYSKLTMAVK